MKLYNLLEYAYSLLNIKISDDEYVYYEGTLLDFYNNTLYSKLRNKSITYIDVIDNKLIIDILGGDK